MNIKKFFSNYFQKINKKIEQKKLTKKYNNYYGKVLYPELSIKSINNLS